MICALFYYQQQCALFQLRIWQVSVKRRCLLYMSLLSVFVLLDPTSEWLGRCQPPCRCSNGHFSDLQAPASLLLSSQSSLRPALSSSPAKSLCSVCPVSRCLLQMSAGWLLGVQWALGSLPAPLFSKRTALSTSAAPCPSRRQTGTATRFIRVKCLWAPASRSKPSTSPSVPMETSRGTQWKPAAFDYVRFHWRGQVSTLDSLLVMDVVTVRWHCCISFAVCCIERSFQ